jgi:polyisoprenoid-binding protein YceI
MSVRRSVVISIGLALLLSAPAWAASWTLENGSAIRFEAYQRGTAVEGRFERFTAEIQFDPDDLPASRIEVEIDTASVSTGHRDRDLTVRSANLLDVEQWPDAHFISARIQSLGGDAYQALGQLTIRDVQKDVVLPFTLRIDDHPGDEGLLQAHASGEITISRLDYGVGQGEWRSTVTIGENVIVALEIVAAAER